MSGRCVPPAVCGETDRKIAAYIGTWGSGGTADTAAIARVHFDAETDRNLSGDKQLAEDVLAAEQTNDEAKRREYYAKAIGRIADQAYWAPMFSYNTNYVTTEEVSYTPTADEVLRFHAMSWN